MRKGTCNVLLRGSGFFISGLRPGVYGPWSTARRGERTMDKKTIDKKYLPNRTRKIVRTMREETESCQDALTVLQAVITLVLGPEWGIVSTKENLN